MEKQLIDDWIQDKLDRTDRAERYVKERAQITQATGVPYDGSTLNDGVFVNIDSFDIARDTLYALQDFLKIID